MSETLTLEDAYRTLEPAEARLGRRINPTIYAPSEFRDRRQSKQPFLTKVLSNAHLVLMGALDGNRQVAIAENPGKIDRLIDVGIDLPYFGCRCEAGFPRTRID